MSETFGRYQLQRKVASGGMAEIFLATTVSIEGFKKQLIIKRMLPKWAKEKHFVTKFIDEAKLTSKLQHANVVQVFDFGRQGDHYFIAAEWVLGCDLSDVVRAVRATRTHVPDALAAYIIEQTCAGLDFAHDYRDPQIGAMKIVHRDVSPGNILLTHEGNVKVADFGIAIAEQRMSETQPGTIHGKVAYMSPEQARGEPLDKRTDVYSTGLVLYELLTGVRALQASTTRDLLRTAQHPQIAPPETHRDDLPGELSAILMQALAPERKRRYASCQDFAEALQRYRVRVTALESALTVARYLKQLFPDGVPDKKGAQAGGAPRATKQLDEAAKREATQGLEKSEVHTAWERQAAHYLRAVIEEPNVWKLMELADKARDRGMESVARGLYRASAAKFAQQGLLLQALTCYRAFIDQATYGPGVEKEILALRGLRGKTNAELSDDMAVGDPLIDPVLERIFFNKDDKSKPTVADEPELVRDLTDKELSALLKIIRPKHAPAGTVLLKQGEKARTIFMIGKGRVMMTAKNKKGEAVTLHTLTHGDLFGEASYFGGAARTSVHAFDEVDYFEISRDDLEHLQAELPNLKKRVGQLYKSRVVDELLWRSELYGLLSAKERLRLVEDAVLKRLPAGKKIFEQGDTSDEIYLVKDGEVHTFVDGQFEGKLVVHDFFGEVSAIRRIPRPQTIKAGPGGAEVAVLNGGTLWKILRKNAEVARAFDAAIDARA